MKKYNNQDIIGLLQNLNEIKPNEKFINRVENILIPSIAPKNPLPFYFSPMRIALCSILFLLIFGEGILIASANSHPGSLLYPLKKAVQIFTTNLQLKPKTKVESILYVSPTNAPTVIPTTQPKPTSTPASNAASPTITPTNSPVANQQTNSIISSTPTISVGTNPISLEGSIGNVADTGSMLPPLKINVNIPPIVGLHIGLGL